MNKAKSTTDSEASVLLKKALDERLSADGFDIKGKYYPIVRECILYRITHSSPINPVFLKDCYNSVCQKCGFESYWRIKQRMFLEFGAVNRKRKSEGREELKIDEYTLSLVQEFGVDF